VADIVLINPRFEVSFFGLEYALPFFGKRANLPVAALPLLAALTPGTHQVTIIDENVEPIDYARCAAADIVALTGMVVQRQRMRDILTELKRRGAFTVVGGPWVTVKEDYFGDLADVIFIGEAEDTWPRFLEEWEGGRCARRYEQAEKTDMTRVPAPRLDLLKMRHYAFGSVQFTRGCPFQCEFCDIIVVFGRRPRIKTAAQIIVELEGLRAQGVSIAFIVDDNLIGNKKAIKEVLRELVAWQRANGFPLTFMTEASIDLADDDELMQLMVEARIVIVFVGIESPNEESLREAKKLQNVRRGGTMMEKVHRIQAAGIEIWAGMMVGFDHDDESVFEAQRRFLDEARISTAMVGMLSAIPKTPLYARLAAAGRLDTADEPEGGTNVLPLGMSRAALSQGYVQLMRDLYAAEPYFERLDGLYIGADHQPDRAWRTYAAAHPWRRRRHNAQLLLEAFGLSLRLLLQVPERELRHVYRTRMLRLLRRRPDPAVLRIYAVKCAMHYHAHRLAERMAAPGTSVINTY
jgi:radical SAM superfamily enzyme YgiQ (UPF0313 family)